MKIIPVSSLNMSIRARFLLAVLSCLGLLASGGCASTAAEPSFAEPTFIDFAAVPPALEDADRLRPKVEPKVAPSGSETETVSGEILEVDAWAEAFAEAARLQAISLPELPEYPIVVNSQVQYFLDRYTGTHRSVVETWMNRSGRYLEMIRQTLRGQGLPTDLAFTAMIESGFDPLAVSRVGAKGMWQFMARTGRLYGLRVDRWVDERLDPEKSTVAAAAYLRDLHAQFGSWPLAQAAYNAGHVAVMRAIRVTGSSDFWVLRGTKFLRRETKDFVPAIQAATLIGRNPDQYGFEPSEPDALEHESVSVSPSTDLRRLATTAGVSYTALRSLNPVLVRGVTPPGTTWELRVPAGTRDGVVAALARRRAGAVAKGGTARPDASSGMHVVRARETVASIAKQYGISVVDLLRWNRLENQDRIRPGDRLRVADLR